MVTGEPAELKPARSAELSDYEVYVEFSRLSHLWREETMGYALRSRAVAHPAHQQIVDLGERVIPWMLDEFAADKGDWFAALHALTGANPIPEEDRGYIARMRADWVEWGREAGWVD